MKQAGLLALGLGHRAEGLLEAEEKRIVVDHVKTSARSIMARPGTDRVAQRRIEATQSRR
jgi:hypothetical protein